MVVLEANGAAAGTASAAVFPPQMSPYVQPLAQEVRSVKRFLDKCREQQFAATAQ
jgi:hypothetical protein